MARTSDDRSVGGIKGFFTRAYHSMQKVGTEGGKIGYAASMWTFHTGGTLAFWLATTAMVTVVPLLFEIGRERQQLDTDRSVVKDLRGQGFGDRQLQELGFPDAAIHQPSVASLKK